MVSSIAAIILGIAAASVHRATVGTGVGQIDPGTLMGVQTVQRDGQSYCAVDWTDTHKCATKFNWLSSCDAAYTVQYGTIAKNKCGNAWFTLCDYTQAYAAGFMWSGSYELTAVDIKKTEFSSTANSHNYSCKYGIKLADHYTGNFSCSSLLSDYRTMLDSVPYDGCVNGS